MDFPLNLLEISLFLAITAIILLITSEILSPRYGKINVQINQKKLRNAAWATSSLFLVSVTIRIISIIFALW
jgi:hypothetical protein